jgi:hypothetical protein
MNDCAGIDVPSSHHRFALGFPQSTSSCANERGVSRGGTHPNSEEVDWTGFRAVVEV